MILNVIGVQEIGCRPVFSSLFHLGTSEAGVEMEFPNFMEDQRIAVADALICQYEAGYLK